MIEFNYYLDGLTLKLERNFIDSNDVDFDNEIINSYRFTEDQLIDWMDKKFIDKDSKDMVIGNICSHFEDGIEEYLTDEDMNSVNILETETSFILDFDF